MITSKSIAFLSGKLSCSNLRPLTLAAKPTSSSSLYQDYPQQFSIRRFLQTERITTTTNLNDGDSVIETRIEVPITKDHNAFISVLSLNAHKTKNALSKDNVYKMLEFLQKFQISKLGDDRVRALIIRSQVPGIFCAGANLKERQSMNKNQVQSWLRIQRSLMDSINDFPYPTIAAIDGHALGGGLELALACDMRIVNSQAKIGLVETRLAIIPGAGGTQRLARLIGIGRAKEHIFVAEPVSGEEAYRLGIANHLATGDQAAFDKAVEVAMKICKRGPLALRLAKAAIDNGCQTSLDTGLDIEHAYYSQLLDSQDRAEGMKAFSEKRDPIYKGD